MSNEKENTAMPWGTDNRYPQTARDIKPGRPKKPERVKFPVDIDKEVLTVAKNKHPKLHAMVVEYIRQLAEDSFDGDINTTA